MNYTETISVEPRNDSMLRPTSVKEAIAANTKAPPIIDGARVITETVRDHDGTIIGFCELILRFSVDKTPQPNDTIIGPLSIASADTELFPIKVFPWSQDLPKESGWYCHWDGIEGSDYEYRNVGVSDGGKNIAFGCCDIQGDPEEFDGWWKRMPYETMPTVKQVS